MDRAKPEILLKPEWKELSPGILFHKRGDTVLVRSSDHPEMRFAVDISALKSDQEAEILLRSFQERLTKYEKQKMELESSGFTIGNQGHNFIVSDPDFGVNIKIKRARLYGERDALVILTEAIAKKAEMIADPAVIKPTIDSTHQHPNSFASRLERSRNERLHTISSGPSS